MKEMSVYVGGQHSPIPAKQNTYDCGQDGGMTRTVGRRYNSKIETVEADGYVA